MTLNRSMLGTIGSLFGLASVGLGAFGAHGLRGRLSPGDLAIFETAVRYQFFHALALLVLAVIVGREAGRSAALASWAFILGIVVFSGSLYVLVLTGERWLGAVTPVGGVSFLIGWSALAWTFSRERGAAERQDGAAESGQGR